MSGEKTEQPTAKKLRDARKKGQVVSSKEITSSLLILSFFTLLAATLPGLVERLERLILLPVPFLDLDLMDAAPPLLWDFAWAMIIILIPFLMIAVIGTIVATTGQFGLLMSFEAVKPSMKKLNPAQYFKKTFGLQNLIEFLKSLIKIAVLSFIIYIIIRDGLNAMVLAPSCGVPCLRAVLGEMLFTLATWCTAPFVIIAAGDYFFQKWQFNKKNMMSKDEVKREYKESEGNPEVKGMRKQLHQQMLQEGSVDRARKATVLVTNPTHIAIAIFYDRDTTPLPIVTAMGKGTVAYRMIEAATEAGVPVMRNVPLARALLDEGGIDQHIPTDLIESFAEVLRAVQNLTPH
ncbi:type III secretion system export apparatus subunit SctU [Hyphomicrobium sp. MC1]|uniref:type III secretion system export apparatus subunit SctU n=1 Tax=Hyphomicrobium sp. (strain MC1) TaxID=717785 RepID=UPI000213EFD7|nr:type III secretion system export apparatus subunit SctU [Hyphomicrobium sp. MC1]CCB66676.1 Yop proteins translocation protein U [Hyphomicrobium sp. MC1]